MTDDSSGSPAVEGEGEPILEQNERGGVRGGIARLWRRYVLWPIHQTEIESRRDLEEQDAERVDSRTVIVCVVVAVNLAVLQYFGMSDRVRWIPDALATLGLEAQSESLAAALMGPRGRLYSLFYWAGSCITMYFIVPALIVKFVFKQRLGDYGLGIGGALSHYSVYVIFYLGILPLVVLVSYNPAFQEQYPFYRTLGGALPEGFLWWELAYAAQFFALEFFFRGFMVHGLKHRFGAYAVVVMAVPYCMIHFGKPFPETLGAIIAGVVLGMLSLRTRSIWLGVAIHVSVAWTMDALALWHAGLLF